jgi:hypothetical protein
MKHYRFYKKDEIEKAEQEKRLPSPTWGIECSQSEIKRYVSILDLESDWYWV